MSEEPDMINAALDIGEGASDKLLLVLVCSLRFKLLEEVKNMLNSD